MSNYGRYFEFRISPRPEDRQGRYITGDAVIPIGAPVKITADVDADGRNVVELATGATVPKKGVNGLAIFEHAFNAYAGYDPTLVNPSDFPDIPANSPIQLVSGPYVKVVFRNIAADTEFLGRTYDDARTMVAPTNLGTLAVGNMLRPGTGDGTSGYWAETSTDAEAWFVITNVDTDRGEVEAVMQF